MAEWKWIAADGTEYSLTGEPFILVEEPAGHLMPAFERKERRIGDVAYLSGIRAAPRDVILPVLVKSSDMTSALRLCARVFNPKTGDGRLVFTDDSGNRRSLWCRYAGGLEGSGRDYGPGWYKVAVRLRALVPYWGSETWKDFLFTLDAPVVFFSSSQPFFPLRISKGTIDGRVTVQNDGDVDAYPVIALRGSFTYAQIRNMTTGKKMQFPSLNMKTSSNDVLVIDARPTALTVLLNGVNAYSLLSADSVLWSIAPGSNLLEITTSGTDSGSSITISFQELYMTA